MLSRLSIALLAIGVGACGGKAPAPSATEAAASEVAYSLAGQVPGAEGSYDYISYDAAQDAVFVGRSFGVEVLDLKAGTYRTLLTRKGVAAVMPIGDALMLSTNGDSNTATLFDRKTGKVTADIPTGKEPDGASYDPASGLAFVANGESQDLTVIDVAKAKAVATIPVEGVPEAAVGDGRGKLFVNLEDLNAIAVIDIAARKVVGRYVMAGCNEPTGIAYDAKTDLLISACHNGTAKLIEASTGKDRGSIAIGQGADGSIFDSERRIGFVPCIDGTLTIYALDEKGQARVLQTVKTSVGARTAVYDTKGDRVFLPTATVERDEKGEYVRAQKDFAVLRVERK